MVGKVYGLGETVEISVVRSTPFRERHGCIAPEAGLHWLDGCREGVYGQTSQVLPHGMVRNLLSVLAAIRLEHSLVMYPACNWWSWILINILICSLFLDLELNRNALGDLLVGVFSFLHGNGKLIPMGYFFLGQFLQRIVVNPWRCPIHQSSRIRDSQFSVKKIKQKKEGKETEVEFELSDPYPPELGDECIYLTMRHTRFIQSKSFSLFQAARRPLSNIFSLVRMQDFLKFVFN